MAQQESTAIATRGPVAAEKFRGAIERSALDMIKGMYSPEQSREAAARVALAFETAARTSKDGGQALRACSKESIGAAITRSLLTDLYPGDSHADVYLVPRGKELSWEITHRGLAKLAARQGYMLTPVAVYEGDTLEIDFGEVTKHKPVRFDQEEDFEKLQGVFVAVKELASGKVIARPWCSKGVILRRKKAGAGTGPAWSQWPIPMAMKAAIKWCSGRGMLPLRGKQWENAVASVEQIEAEDADSPNFFVEDNSSTVDLPPEPEST